MTLSKGGLFIGIGILAEAAPLIECDTAFGKVIFRQLRFKAEGFVQQGSQFLQQAAAKTAVAALRLYGEMLDEYNLAEFPNR